MAGFIPVKDLEAKRRALVAESEVYRQTLLLEVMNVRLSSVKTRRQFSNAIQPWLLVVAPLGAIIGIWRNGGTQVNRARRKGGMLGKILLGYRLYRRFGPVVRPWLEQIVTRFQAAPVVSPPSAASVQKPMNEQPV